MKEQYNKLLRHSSMQQKKIDSMQKTMEQIVTNLGVLSKVVDKIDGIEGKPLSWLQPVAKIRAFSSKWEQKSVANVNC